MRRPVWYVVASVACFWAFLIVCYALIPTDWSRQGISHFGNSRASVLPYSAGLLSSAFFMVLGANTLPDSDPKFVALARLLRALAVLLVAQLFTPSWRFGSMVGWLHKAVGATLFVCQVMLGLHLCLTTRRRRSIAALFAVQLVGTFMVLLSALKSVQLMFGAQMVTELVFGLLLVVGTDRIMDEGEPLRSREGNHVTPETTRLTIPMALRQRSHSA